MSRRNVVAERKFSEMLERAMRSYNNRSLTAAEVIAELVELAKEMKTENGPRSDARPARRRAGLLRCRLPERFGRHGARRRQS